MKTNLNNSIGPRLHFHTFDALRFFAFFLVFLQHVSDSNAGDLVFFTKSGGVGVSFFFVLSGFLITYILLHEKLTNGSISLSRFFVRRMLRIWPLFYAMILFAFLTPYILEYFNLSSSNAGYDPDWLMSSLFLENYKMMMTNDFPNASPLRVMWTLCVEEHFYILWGILIYLISPKRIPAAIVISIIGANIIRVVYTINDIPRLDLFSNLDYFAFGAIPAYLLLCKQAVLPRIERIPVPIKYATLVLTIGCMFAIPNLDLGVLHIFTPLIFSILFIALILFTLPPTNRIYISDSNLISRLGLFTYGLYLFHTVIINFLLRVVGYSTDAEYYIFIIAALCCTIALSFISYYIFEKPFLRLKSLINT